MDEKVLGDMFERAQAKRSDDMKFTPEESDRFKKAFEDPEFRKMFAEYMDEIQDPNHREETENYISQLETEDKVPQGKQLIRPSPGFVAKTYKLMDGQEEQKDKMFINIVQSDKIAEPTKQSTPKGDCWSLPYSLGPPHMEKDKKGDNSTCFDCCYHPMALQLGSMNANFRNMLVTTAMDGVEEAYKRQGHKVTLDRQFHVVKGLSYKEGQVPTMMVAISSLENWNQTSNNNTSSTSTSSASKTKVVGAGSTVAGPAASASTAALAENGDSKPVAATKDGKKKSAGLGIKKGFLNSAKTSIYEDKIPTLRPGTRASNDASKLIRSPEEEEAHQLAEEEEAVSRLLGDLTVNDKSAATKKQSNQKTTSTTPILPLGEDNMIAHHQDAALEAAALLSSSKPSTTAVSEENMLKAVSTKTLAKTTANPVSIPPPSLTVAPTQNGNEASEKLPPAVPKVVVKHRDNASLGDFEGTNSTSVASTRPKELIYEIQLPMVTAPSKIVLDVSEKRLCLTYQETYKLDMALPYKVIDKKGKAAYDKSKKALIVTLPVEPVAITNSHQSNSTTNSATNTSGITEVSSTSNNDEADEEEEDSKSKAKASTKRATRASLAAAGSTAVKHDRWVANNSTNAATETAAAAAVETESEKLKREVFEAAEKAKEQALLQQKSAGTKENAKKKATPAPAVVSATAQLDEELAASEQEKAAAKDYISAVKFIGRKEGYVFHMGDKGLGYYLDTYQLKKNAPIKATATTANSSTSATTNVATAVATTNVVATESNIEWQSIPYEVQETPQAIAFLFQVPHILGETVRIVPRGQEIMVSFQALVPGVTSADNGENQDVNNATSASTGAVSTTKKNVQHYGSIFTFSVSLPQSAENASLFPSTLTHDVASKNMVLLLPKSQPGVIWQQSAVSTTASSSTPWLTVRSYEDFSVSATPVATPNVITAPESVAKKAAPTTATVTTTSMPPTTSVTTTSSATAVKALISSMQFSSDLVAELD